MSTSDAIALGAAIFAAISSGGTVYAVKVSRDALNFERGKSETKVNVDVKHRAKVPDRGISFGTGTERKIYQLVVDVINDGETKESLSGVELSAIGGAKTAQKHLGGDRELGSRCHLDFAFDAADVSEVTAGEFIAVARLASGKVFESAIQRLGRGIQDEVDEYNNGLARGEVPRT